MTDFNLPPCTFLRSMKLVQCGQNKGLWQQEYSIEFDYTALSFQHSIKEIENYNGANIYIGSTSEFIQIYPIF